MKKPTLVILAAGMGSRYGGLKQLDGVGPNGETLLEYSIHDAILSGFGKVVFIIRESFETEFKAKVVSKFSDKIKTEIVFQKIGNLPEPYQCPEDRQKPWGTGQAVLAAAPKVKEPFAVINADDFYGQEAFKMMAEILKERSSSKADWVMIAYKLGKTLSENGSVSRGICSINENQKLMDITEHTQIIDSENGPKSIEGETSKELSHDTPVSMNFFGFTPDIFDWLEKQFKAFLEQNLNNSKSEFYLPAAVNLAIKNKRAQVEVAKTNATWIGVTYPEDKDNVCKKIDELVKTNY